METPESIDTWGILEIMGHVRLAGRIRLAAFGGAALCRIDIPQDDGSLRTSYYGVGSIYAIHPSDEATARAVAAHHQSAPIHRWELLPPGKVQPLGPGEREEDEDDEAPRPYYAYRHHDDGPGF